MKSLTLEEPLAYTQSYSFRRTYKCFQCYCVVDSTIMKSYLSFHRSLLRTALCITVTAVCVQRCRFISRQRYSLFRSDVVAFLPFSLLHAEKKKEKHEHTKGGMFLDCVTQHFVEHCAILLCFSHSAFVGGNPSQKDPNPKRMIPNESVTQQTQIQPGSWSWTSFDLFIGFLNVSRFVSLLAHNFSIRSFRECSQKTKLDVL